MLQRSVSEYYNFISISKKTLHKIQKISNNEENMKMRIYFLIFRNASFEERKELMKKRQGFTLLELMIVVVILGVLALIAVPSLLNAARDSKNGVIQANVSAAATKVVAEMTKTGFDLDTDVIDNLNDGATNPFTNEVGAVYVNGACAAAGTVGIAGAVDTGFTITGCGQNSDGDPEQVISKEIPASSM